MWGCLSKFENDLLDLSYFFPNLDRFTSLFTLSTTARRTDDVVQYVPGGLDWITLGPFLLSHCYKSTLDQSRRRCSHLVLVAVSGLSDCIIETEVLHRVYERILRCNSRSKNYIYNSLVYVDKLQLGHSPGVFEIYDRSSIDYITRELLKYDSL
jgi:hypothetical protein